MTRSDSLSEDTEYTRSDYTHLRSLHPFRNQNWFNKYERFLKPVTNFEGEGFYFKTLRDDFLKAIRSYHHKGKVNADELYNLISDDERLSFISGYLSQALISPQEYLHFTVDDLEFTFDLPQSVLDNFSVYFEELRTLTGVTIRFGEREEMKLKYRSSWAFDFPQGGTLYLHHTPTSDEQNNCHISFRLAENRWRDIEDFFFILKKAFEESYKPNTSEEMTYESCLCQANVTRFDPNMIFNGIPMCMLLIDNQYIISGRRPSNEIYPKDAEKSVLSGVYSGNRKKSSHFYYYDTLIKFITLIDGFKEIPKEAMASLLCESKVERRYDGHNSNKIKMLADVDTISSYFGRLKFYSPLIFKAFGKSISVKVLRFGIREVEEYLTDQELKKFKEVIQLPEYTLNFQAEEAEMKVKLLTNKLKRVILTPNNMRHEPQYLNNLAVGIESNALYNQNAFTSTPLEANISEHIAISSKLNLSKISYAELNSKQKEIFNFQKVAAKLADFGFNCIKLADDWQGADFLAYHKDGVDTLKVQLKSRLTIDQRYQGKDLCMCFPINEDWYLIEHDLLIEYVTQVTNWLKTKSWLGDGCYHSIKPSKRLISLMKPYIL
jgi:hypothetical protein